MPATERGTELHGERGLPTPPFWFAITMILIGSTVAAADASSAVTRGALSRPSLDPLFEFVERIDHDASELAIARFFPLGFLWNTDPIRRAERVKVDVKTLSGDELTARHTKERLGSALLIAPGFVATSVDDATGVETSIEAVYRAERGRYVITGILNRAISADFNENRLKHAATQAIVQADGRIIPTWMADAVVKRGMMDERWEVIEILYGTAALSDLPPVNPIAAELGAPERTASFWIQQARRAGWLIGMTSNVGRPAGPWTIEVIPCRLARLCRPKGRRGGSPRPPRSALTWGHRGHEPRSSSST